MKKILFSILIISVMFMVFFSPQNVDAQTVQTVDPNGEAKNIFFDYVLPDCTIPDVIYASGQGFMANSIVDIYFTPWPSNGNQGGLFSSGQLVPLGNLPYQPIQVNTDPNGDFYIVYIIGPPPFGDWNLIVHGQDGTANWNPAVDAIDMVDNYGFKVLECEEEEEYIERLEAVFNQRMGDIVDKLNYKGGKSAAIVLKVADDGQVSGGSSAADSPAVYVAYPDDDGQLSANGDYEILTPIISSDIEFGHSIASGDFNGDGIGDLAIGVPDEDVSGKSNSGAVYVYYGLSGNEFSNPQVFNEVNLNISLKSNDSFGWSLAVGDFNRDTYDDLAIGIPNHPISGNSKAGMVSVIYGGDSLNDHKLDFDTSEKWYQNSSGISGVSEAGDKFGWSLTTGDFDNNGFDDLAIGSPYEDIGKQSNAGAVNVIYGGMDSHAKLTSKNNQLWHQNVAGIHGASESGDYFGWSLTTGVFDGDDYDDLAIGVPYEGIGSNPDAGAVNVIYGGYGSLHRLDSLNNQMWYQGEKYRIEGFLDSNDRFGYSLTSGDFNDDTYDDLAIGVPYEMIDEKGGAGAVNVIYSNYYGLSTIGNQLWSQDVAGMLGTSEPDDNFSWSIIAADFNNNGIDDLAIGIPSKNIDNVFDVGAISIIYGIQGSAEDGWGLNAEGNQYWQPGS